MNKTKSIALTIILLIFLESTLSIAQDNSKIGSKSKYRCTPEEQAKRITDKMKTQLGLSDEQYNKILQLQTDRIKYLRELREKDLISRSEVKKKREEFRNNINNILTDEQQKKMKSKKKNRKQRMKIE